LFLTGPTAAGKSEVALALAERLGGEIVCADSMQVYRGLDIGTAKPTASERERVRHHLLDVVDLTESFDAARYVALAQEAVLELQARGRRAIFCGGTGLYLKAFLQGLGESPPADPKLRADLIEVPLPDLLQELREKDPAAYSTIDRQNPRRVRRAVEILRLSGRPISAQRASWSRTALPAAGQPRTLFALTRPTAQLYRRIDARVDEMFARGLVAETEALLARGAPWTQTALQAIGYRQVLEYLRGERSLPETVSQVKQRTRRFAKRQLTYLRHQLPVTWVDWGATESAPEVAGRVERLFQSRP
jgi:tRNA dimethylallyltransferase